MINNICNHSCAYSNVSHWSALHGITARVTHQCIAGLQILARASEEKGWQPKWWGSLSEWIMDNLWMPLGGHSHMTMIILSYKPLVMNHLWLRKPPQLCLNHAPRQFRQNHIVCLSNTYLASFQLEKKSLKDGLIMFSWAILLEITPEKDFDHNKWLILANIISWLPQDLQPPKGILCPGSMWANMETLRTVYTVIWRDFTLEHIHFRSISKCITGLSHHYCLQNKW